MNSDVWSTNMLHFENLGSRAEIILGFPLKLETSSKKETLLGPGLGKQTLRQTGSSFGSLEINVLHLLRVQNQNST